jgi:hypothetical protein
MAAIRESRGGKEGCPVCDGEGEIVVSQNDTGHSNFMGHNVEPCPLCEDYEEE